MSIPQLGWDRALAPARAFESSLGPGCRRCECPCGYGYVIIHTYMHTNLYDNYRITAVPSFPARAIQPSVPGCRRHGTHRTQQRPGIAKNDNNNGTDKTTNNPTMQPPNSQRTKFRPMHQAQHTSAGTPFPRTHTAQRTSTARSGGRGVGAPTSGWRGRRLSMGQWSEDKIKYDPFL